MYRHRNVWNKPEEGFPPGCLLMTETRRSTLVHTYIHSHKCCCWTLTDTKAVCEHGILSYALIQNRCTHTCSLVIDELQDRIESNFPHRAFFNTSPPTSPPIVVMAQRKFPVAHVHVLNECWSCVCCVNLSSICGSEKAGRAQMARLQLTRL